MSWGLAVLGKKNLLSLLIRVMEAKNTMTPNIDGLVGLFVTRLRGYLGLANSDLLIILNTIKPIFENYFVFA